MNYHTGDCRRQSQHTTLGTFNATITRRGRFEYRSEQELRQDCAESEEK